MTGRTDAATTPLEVLHCVYSVAVGGQEMVILALASHADRSRFAPRVLCLDAAGELAPRFAAAGIPVDVLDASVRGGGLKMVRALHRYLRQRRPAVLHTHNPGPHQYGALARLRSGVPVLVHTKHGRNHELGRKGRALERLAGRLTDMVVPVSSDAADVARDVERVPSNRIRVIRNGIDLAGSARPQRTTAGWRAVHVARLNVVKDQTTLLRAARIVLDRQPRFELDIVGDGEMRPALERLAAELQLGRAVRFHGYHDDVRPFLAAADAFVLSSVSEGIAISLLEAMAAALPVIATRVGGTPEVVVDSGTGYLVPARDPAAMAAALITLLSQPDHARSLGAAGRTRVEECFTLGATVQAYESLYLEMLNRRLGRKGPA